MGNEFVFRVFTNNLVGSSQEPCTSKDSALIQKIGETSAISTLLISPAAKKKLLTVAPLRYGIQAAHAQGSWLLAGSQVHAPSGKPLCHCGIQCHPQLFRQRHTQGQFIVIKNERSNLTKTVFLSLRVVSLAWCQTVSIPISLKWPGTRTRWTSQMRPSTGCSASTEFWRWRSVNLVPLMAGFTCARQSTTAGRTRWSVSWKFGVSVFGGGGYKIYILTNRVTI